MTHEHGGSNTLAGNISAQKEKIPIRGEVIAIVAAHHPCRLIVVGELPSCCEGVLRGKQPPLNSGGQCQVKFESFAFVAREIIETKPNEWICQQTVALYRVAADFAQPKLTVVHTGKCRINLVEEERKAWLSRRRLQGSLEASVAPLQFRPKVGLFRCGHCYSCVSMRRISEMFHPFLPSRPAHTNRFAYGIGFSHFL